MWLCFPQIIDILFICIFNLTVYGAQTCPYCNFKTKIFSSFLHQHVEHWEPDAKASLWIWWARYVGLSTRREIKVYIKQKMCMKGNEDEEGFTEWHKINSQFRNKNLLHISSLHFKDCRHYKIILNTFYMSIVSLWAHKYDLGYIFCNLWIIWSFTLQLS